MMGFYGWGNNYGMMNGFGGIVCIIMLVIIIAIVAWGVKEAQNKYDDVTRYREPSQPSKKTEAFEILDKRFASGEISEEEYKKRKKALED